MPSVRHETVLITGAGQRIGRALALDFATRGWQIGLHCHASRAETQRLAEEIRKGGGAAGVLTADLTVAAEAEGLIPACAATLGPPACLINNAAMFVYDEISTLDAALWDAQLAVNLRAPALLAKAFTAHLPAGANGNIINMIDQRVWRPTPHYYSYAVAKAGLWSMTRMLAQALAPRIRVNAVGPGPALPNAQQTEAEFRAQCAATLLGRGTTPQEIAAAIRFILEAPAMTGQMIVLDGGEHLAWETPDAITPRG